MTSACRHPVCERIGGACSLATGMSRGCRTGWHPARELAREVIDELRELLVDLDPATAPSPRQQVAAIRLAYLVRREARDERNLVLLADLEPELQARLEALCRRAPT